MTLDKPPRELPFSASVSTTAKSLMDKARGEPQTTTVPVNEPSGISPIYIDSEYWSYHAWQPRKDIPGFLARDLDTSRLDCIFELLWWAGRPVPPRPLYRWNMLGVKIAVVEQADLHLVWSKESLFLKPLPAYLLEYSTWEQYLCKQDDLVSTYKQARGFLLSYVWLIRHKSEFDLAIRRGILPDGLTWPVWRELVRSLCDHFGDLNHPQAISKRYVYGSLRLGRLDTIYRLAPRFGGCYLIDGYLQSYSSYGGFFKRNFGWFIIAVVYLSTVLTAMQLGISTEELQGNRFFNRLSYGVAVAVTLFLIIVSAALLVMYLGLWGHAVYVTKRAHSHGTKSSNERDC